MTVPAIETARLRLVSPDARCLEHLLKGEDVAAAESLDMTLPRRLGESAEGLLRIRLADLRTAPIAQRWLLRVISEREPPRPMVGFAGFHGPPDRAGRVEVGYEVLVDYRRRGYALEATRGLLEWARDHGARKFSAAIALRNVASIGVAEGLGFRRLGSRWDALHGTELLLELDADRLDPAGARMGHRPGDDHG